MRSIAWLAEKGGVGKSTLAINTSVGLAKLGNRVLVIDGDAQANASMIFLKGRAPDAPTLLDVLTNEVEVSETILATDIPNLELVPADGSLADANVLLAAELGRERRLRLAMQDVAESYDFVVVDAGPARSLLNVNILNFVGEIYAPVDPGIFALAGLMKLQEAVEGVVKFLDNSALKISGLVVNRVQRDNLSRDTEAQLRQAFGPLVMSAVIPASTKIDLNRGVILRPGQGLGIVVLIEPSVTCVHGRLPPTTVCPGGAVNPRCAAAERSAYAAACARSVSVSPA